MKNSTPAPFLFLFKQSEKWLNEEKLSLYFM